MNDLPTPKSTNKEHHKVPGIYPIPIGALQAAPFFEWYPLNDFFIWIVLYRASGAYLCRHYSYRTLFLSEELMCKTVFIMFGVGIIFALVVILMAVIDEYLYGHDS